MKTKNLILTIVALLTLSGFLSSCKKYEEGPTLSLRSKSERVANEWKIDYAFDTEDSEVITEKYINETWTFTKENEWLEREDQMIEKSGTWDFINENESIKITISPTDIKYYDILKLKEDELWLKGEDKELHLIPLEK